MVAGGEGMEPVAPAKVACHWWKDSWGLDWLKG